MAMLNGLFGKGKQQVGDVEFWHGHERAGWLEKQGLPHCGSLKMDSDEPVIVQASLLRPGAGGKLYALHGNNKVLEHKLLNWNCNKHRQLLVHTSTLLQVLHSKTRQNFLVQIRCHHASKPCNTKLTCMSIITPHAVLTSFIPCRTQYPEE